MVKQYFYKLRGMRTESEDDMYQAATALAYTLGYSEEHVSVRSKYTSSSRTWRACSISST